MVDIKFKWDTRKNKQNIQKHRISFDEAQTVFYDDYARIIFDPDHSDDEDRFILLGTSIGSRLLAICHCVRSEDSIRIISARKAQKQERKTYEEFRNA